MKIIKDRKKYARKIKMFLYRYEVFRKIVKPYITCKSNYLNFKLGSVQVNFDQLA